MPDCIGVQELTKKAKGEAQVGDKDISNVDKSHRLPAENLRRHRGRCSGNHRLALSQETDRERRL